jgi:serine/threonine-protein kinase
VSRPGDGRLPSPEEWARLSAVLDELLELPPAEQRVRLEAECGQDETLRARLEWILAADAGADRFLDSATAAGFHALVEHGSSTPTAEDADDDGTGARVGPWRLVRELGRGGMGAVYLAERDDGQFQQTVALKVVKRGMDTDEVLGRFLAERRILARLDHPNIARLLDGGVTAEGRPYFALEYVEGTPIVAYCAERALALEARVGLMQQVCDAVHYAHRSLVVHRDLKPSNILVTREGRPKLLDFGIAKLLDTDEGLTGTGARVMTPEYAAPEQVRGDAVTTATDVFALGLLLYEVATGRRWDRARHDGGGRVGSDDLQAIIEMAVREEPERRYASAEALAADLRRFVDGLPVLARKGTATYRLRRFVRRHRAGVFAAAAVALATIAGVAGTLWQARLATEEAAKTKAVKDYLVSVFEVSDPNKARGEQVTARELLDRGAARIEQELGGQPALAAEVLVLVGSLHLKLGSYDRAAPLLERGAELQRQVHGRDSAAVADALSHLGDVYSLSSDFERAERLRRDALSIHRQRLGPAHTDTVSSADGLARVLLKRGRHEEARRLVDETLLAIRQDRGEENEDYATSLNTLHMLLWNQGRYAEAEPVMRRVLEIYVKVLGERHTRVAESYSNLGTAAMTRGDAVEGERMLRKALEIGTSLYGGEHPNLGITLNNLSKALQEQGRIDEAIALQRRALALRTRQLGEGNPQLAVNFHNLALLLRERGDYAEAEKLLQETVAMNRRLLGDEHVSQVITFGSLALVLSESGQPAKAEPLFRQSIALFRSKKLEKHAKFAEVLEGLGAMLDGLGRRAEAEPLLREALDRRRQALGDESWRTAAAKAQLARCLDGEGRHEEARLLAAQAHAVLRRERGEQHPLTRMARSVLSDR